MSDARMFALEALKNLDCGCGAQAALDRSLRTFLSGIGDSKAHPRDVALATELFYGVLRREIQCRWILQRKLRDAERLPNDIKYILLMGAYALLFLRRVPHYATVDHAVKYTRDKYNKKLAGLVNAVLRGIGREIEQYGDFSFYEQECRSELEAVAVFHSLPLWVADLWQKAYARDKFMALLEQSISVPLTSLRINAAMPEAENLRQNFLAAGCKAVGDFGVAGAADLMSGFDLPKIVHDGLAARQGTGSQAVIQALAPKNWPGPIWDVCAGYGGKSMLLLEQNYPLLMASDLNQARLYGLKGQAMDRGFTNLSIFRADVRALPVDSFSGTILLDAPCSGLGVLAGRPDIKRNRTEKDVATLIKIQDALLRSCFSVLNSGSCLVYITCTRNPEENEIRIGEFLRQHSNAALLKEWESPISKPWVEGMYGALLAKE